MEFELTTIYTPTRIFMIHSHGLCRLSYGQSEEGGISRFLKAIGLSRKKIEEHINNPFLNIPGRIAKKCEKFYKTPNGWLDEQHVETDPV